MVGIEVDFNDDEFLHIALMAHERDIIINQYVRDIIEEHMKLTEENQSGTSNN